METLNYKDDPRAVLCHFNKNHDPKTGQFTSSGFGMSKYVNRDGSLTKEGKARLALEKKRNDQKKKDDRVKGTPEEVEKILTDPHKWVREDLSEMETAFKSGSNLTSQVKSAIEKSESKKPLVRKKKLDLSNMTDAELNAQINRYLLEQRYQDVFNPKEPPEVKKGKRRLMDILEVGGSALAIGASAVTIAKAIHEMRKK